MKAFAKRLIGSRWPSRRSSSSRSPSAPTRSSKEWNEVHHALGQIGLLASFEALLVLLVMQFATLRQWQSLLAGLGSPIRTTTAGRIFFIGQLGKYIPGSVWPILTQMELGARANVPRVRSASASILTMILSLAGGLLVAAATMPVRALQPGLRLGLRPRPGDPGLPLPGVLNPLLNRLFKLTKRPGLDQPVTLAMVSRALAWSLVAWLANGVQIWILADKLGAPAGRTFAIALGGYAFAWCVGFVAIFDPAGAGIRDALLVAALAPVLGLSAGPRGGAGLPRGQHDQRPARRRGGRGQPPPAGVPGTPQGKRRDADPG